MPYGIPQQTSITPENPREFWALFSAATRTPGLTLPVRPTALAGIDPVGTAGRRVRDGKVDGQDGTTVAGPGLAASASRDAEETKGDIPDTNGTVDGSLSL